MNIHTDIGNKKVSHYKSQIRGARKRDNQKTIKKVHKYKLKKTEHVSNSLSKADSNYMPENEMNTNCTRKNLDVNRKTNKYRKSYFKKIMNSSVKMLFIDLIGKSLVEITNFYV